MLWRLSAARRVGKHLEQTRARHLTRAAAAVTPHESQTFVFFFVVVCVASPPLLFFSSGCVDTNARHDERASRFIHGVGVGERTLKNMHNMNTKTGSQTDRQHTHANTQHSKHREHQNRCFHVDDRFRTDEADAARSSANAPRRLHSPGGMSGYTIYYIIPIYVYNTLGIKSMFPTYFTSNISA